MAEGAAQQPKTKSTPATATGTSSSSPKNEGSAIGLIAALVILGGIPLFIVFGLVIGMFRAGGPNPSGATIPQKINVANPTSELRNLLSVYSGASNIQTYLQNNGAVLDSYRDNLTLLQTKIESGNEAYAGVRDRAAVLALIPTLQEQINVIRADVTSAQKEKLVADVKAFAENLKKIDRLIAPDIVALATKYATENAESGYTKYPYDKKRREQFLHNLEGYSDCSSFVSSMMYQLGFVRVKPNYTTISLYQAAKSGQFGLSIIEESTSIGIDASRMRELLQPGDMILSSRSVPYSRGADAKKHVVMYIGNNQVVHSTSTKTTNGIQLSSLDSRLTNSKIRNFVIIRAGGAQ